MSQRFKIHVPLGDAGHPDEEKGTTKVVRRTLTDVKGRAGSRTATVYWRGQYHAVKEDGEFFGCVRVVKETDESPRATNPDLTKGGGRKKATQKKAAKKKGNGNGAKSAPASKSNGNGNGAKAKAKRKAAKKASPKSAKRAA